jgi:predicted porin
MGVVKFYAGYENIKYENPKSPLAAGFDLAAYRIAFVNDNAYAHEKILQVYWGGVRYTVLPQLDLVGAYYGYHQSNFATTAANAGCTTNKSGTCRGTEEVISFDADYRLSKRFDTYAGVMYSGVHDGLANGYSFHTTDITTTAGVRFKF